MLAYYGSVWGGEPTENSYFDTGTTEYQVVHRSLSITLSSTHHTESYM